MTGKIEYTFTAPLWKYAGKGGWYFVSLPEAFSREIRSNLQWQESGWGRMPATAEVSRRSWSTAIWYDTGRGTYLLPVKKDIRMGTGMAEGDEIAVRLTL